MAGADRGPPPPALPTVYTIPPAAGFVDALAAGIWAEVEGDPARLARVTVLLPTRRACRALREAFLRQRDGQPLLLPRMRPIGDVDEDELAILGGESEGLDLPPAMPDLRRNLLLARLILSLPGRGDGRNAVQAIELAAELARLIDQVDTERLSFAALATLVPEDYAAHWQQTLEFLKIVTTHWPDIVAREGTIDPARRRNLMLEALAQRWTAAPPADPVYAAGSTGSVPATADLLTAVARLPRGAVVLPGLDRDLDAAAWGAVDPPHPQWGLKQLLDKIGLAREAVRDWPGAGLDARAKARARLVSLALRPSEATDGWRGIGPEVLALAPAALDGLKRIDCASPQQEAGVIALLLREALEEKGRTAALVTADRDLARRVAAELARFDIAIDDSAGRKLSHTPRGAFLALSAEMIASGAPVPLLACLKHPLAAGGLAPPEFRRRVRQLEIAVLRGPRPGEGIAGLAAALAEARPDDRDMRRWLDALAAMAAGFARAMSGPPLPLEDLVTAHIAFAEDLAATDDASGAARLWGGAEGPDLAAFIADLRAAAVEFPRVAGREYPALLSACLAGRVMRPSHGRHPRLAVLGLLEARLLAADLLVLGGLNEGSWPPAPGADPWMSRPMRERFGLPSLDRRIGLSAHDFAQACNARAVVLTRAVRVEGTPTVPSRWLLRLDNLLRTAGLDEGLPTRPEPVVWQRALDHVERLPPADPPAPRPPVAARPRSLSVTAVETWRRDPYAIYARRILRLRALDPLDADPGLADYGSAIHAALDDFVRSCPVDLPADTLERLIAFGRERFGPALARPGIWAFWWPRFERIAAWFVAFERERRAAGALPLATEVNGALVLTGPGGPFRLTAKADRIDRLADARLAIIDYKTGSVPSLREVQLGYAAQLPLEAAIAAAGGFEGVPAAEAAELRHWRLSGGDPAGEEHPIDGGTVGRERTKLPLPAELAREAVAGLERLIARFDDPATPYHARPRPDYLPRYGDYDHLARVKEWSAVEDRE